MRLNCGLSKVNKGIPLKRTLRRNPSFRVFGVNDADDPIRRDIGWLWAAYQHGGIDDIGIPEGLDKDEFDALARQALERFDEAFVMEAGKPVGIMTARLEQREDGPDKMEPHAHWFPWASAREKLEATVKFIAGMDGFKVLVWAKPQAKTFFNHVCKRGILQRVGTVPGYFETEGGCLFTSRERK